VVGPITVHEINYGPINLYPLYQHKGICTYIPKI
jgi:hypothetical protein